MSGDDRYPIQATRTFPGTARECRAVRSWIRGLLRPFPQPRDAVELVVSELFSNAVRHTASGDPGGRVEVAVAVIGRDPDTIRLEVVDQGARADRPRTAARALMPTPDSQHGRGLFLASILSREWGRSPAAEPGIHHPPVPDSEHPEPMFTWAEFTMCGGTADNDTPELVGCG